MAASVGLPQLTTCCSPRSSQMAFRYPRTCMEWSTVTGPTSALGTSRTRPSASGILTLALAAGTGSGVNGDVAAPAALCPGEPEVVPGNCLWHSAH